jgi:tRNA threonylcarbamoyladenosine biosynthesis protein TsaB
MGTIAFVSKAGGETSMDSQGILLGIDTSSAWGSVGLLDERGLLASTTVRVSGGHARGLVSRVESLLDECGARTRDLRAIGVTQGPGSFTALRVGASCAQGLGMGLEIPVVPVPTHQAVVAGLPPLPGPVLVLVSARRGEVFAGSFVHSTVRGWVPENGVRCVAVEDLPSVTARPVLVAGPGVFFHEEEVRAVYENTVVFAPSACSHIRGETLAQIAREKLREIPDGFPAERVVVDYLQSHGALTIEERKEGRSHAK